MLSLPQAIFSSPIAPELFGSISIRSLPLSENAISIRASSRGHRLVARVRVSDRKNMAELAGVDRFGIGDAAGDGGCGEPETILRRWASNDYEATLNRLSKWLVAGLFGLVILWRHDAEALWAAMGSVVNAWLSIKLKQALNQDRPSALKSDPGMPSSHAQSIFYAAVYFVASLTSFMGINVVTIGAGVITLLCGSYLSWMRVSQRFHTVSQVLVGAAVGSACSLAWFWTWHSLVLPAFISSIWVRVFVILVSASFSAAFLVYVIQNWLQDD